MVISTKSGAKVTPGIGALGKTRLALNNSVNSKMLSSVIVTEASIMLVVESNVYSAVSSLWSLPSTREKFFEDTVHD